MYSLPPAVNRLISSEERIFRGRKVCFSSSLLPIAAKRAQRKSQFSSPSKKGDSKAGSSSREEEEESQTTLLVPAAVNFFRPPLLPSVLRRFFSSGKKFRSRPSPKGVGTMVRSTGGSMQPRARLQKALARSLLPSGEKQSFCGFSRGYSFYILCPNQGFFLAWATKKSLHCNTVNRILRR